MEGLTTSEVANMLGLTWAGASKLMKSLQVSGEPMITCLDSRWVVTASSLQEACHSLALARSKHSP
jgi:hypothetical protein